MMRSPSYIKSLGLFGSAFVATTLLVSSGAEPLSFLKRPAQARPLLLATPALSGHGLRPLAVVGPSTTSLDGEPGVQVGQARAAHAIDLESLPAREQRIRLRNVNTRERATFALSPRGFVRAEDEAALQRFFGCRRTGRIRPISNEVLVLLAAIASRWPDRVIEVVSGYRAPPYGVPHSRHFRGEAIDLRVRGIRTAKVRDFVWREHRGVGVGHYTAGDFLHVDTRSDEPDTAWSARQEGGDYDYEPRWARRARRGRPAVLASTGSVTTSGPTLASAH